ncbi:MAG: signal recognition particle protein [Flavobacteriia bacterium]|jgi:signal recognition particle subunit SRP54|nr:signal recognition particle protein [Flavobacteriia bacterium]
MFENLSEKLEKAFHSLKGRDRITEINVAESLKEVRRALVEADVSYKVAKEFVARVKEKAIGQEVLTSLKPGQVMVKVTRDEMADLMGGNAEELSLDGKPNIILIAGLQGSGKTTFSGKLASYLKRKKAKRPLLVACDVYRPAAIDQLKVLGEQVGVEVFSQLGNPDPVDIASQAVQHARAQGFSNVIVDTAGRLAVDQEMMDEIGRVHKAIQPNETLFVVDSMTGQDAVNTARAFHDVLNYDGVVLTKLDGDTRGGAALTIRSVVDKPIKFIGTGEKVDALDVFHPDRMADRILGMGDVVSLVEKAQEQFDEEQARKVQKKIAQNRFGFDDFLQQLQQIKKMGNVKDLLGMVPGMGKALKGVDIDDDAFKGVEAMIQSMTPEERSNPSLIRGSRKKRIAIGSGTQVEEVNRLLKQFQDMSKMMRSMQSAGGRGMAQAMMRRRR